ncbi:homoserine dehydrogenase [Streptomyces bohaiensis]|uniref:Homoserine dehydrogenase n=1 Tax=Streptomyces bohaiensis TaxID=1431344 RepID=A0ABX1CGE2_9ACTN|nr:homoserine dehydrogenase [Streptomyces bohaiensis]NJQ17253.1 homoserine dehydrogenase [Streptomyces bohaiensis]
MNAQQAGAQPVDRTVTYALTGACGGFARTLLAQTRRMPNLRASVLCDLDTDGVHALAADLGFPTDELVTVGDSEALTAAVAAGRTAVVADSALLAAGGFDILVEATGSPAVGYRAARTALTGGRHVAMVSKEVDSVSGVELASIAAEHGVVYTTATGDQPANLIQWFDWARGLGLEIVAIGKSGEYDLVYDPEAATVTQLGETIDAPALGGLLKLGDDVRTTLAARAEAVAPLKRSAAADYCEMAVVATSTGFTADVEAMHYPVARVAELADVYALREHGGVSTREGVVDVFSVLRLPEEASFAGGVFAVVRTHDPVTWQTLAQKGHVVSRDGRYACLYLPYHLMGVETPTTLLDAVLRGVPAGSPSPRQHVVLGGRTTRGLPAGTVLTMGGHHHEVEGVAPVLLATDDAPADAAPLYLAAHAVLATDVPAGELLTIGHLTGHDAELLAAWRAGLALPRGGDGA